MSADPFDVARLLLNALVQGQGYEVAKHIHPSGAADFKRYILQSAEYAEQSISPAREVHDDLARLMPKGELQYKIIFGVRSVPELAALPESELIARSVNADFVRRQVVLADSHPSDPTIDQIKEVKPLGYVVESKDAAHVVYRCRRTVHGKEASYVTILTMVRDAGRWYAGGMPTLTAGWTRKYPSR